MSRVTLAKLEEYFELEKARLAANRKASDIRKLQNALKLQFTEHVVENGGAEKTVVTCGYRLFLKAVNGTVPWKEEYLKVAGQKAAEKLLAAVANTEEELVVEPPPE